MLNRSINFRLQPSHLLLKQMYFIYKTSRTWDVNIKAESDFHWVSEYDLKEKFLSALKVHKNVNWNWYYRFGSGTCFFAGLLHCP